MPTHIDGEPYLTVDEVVKALGVKRETLYAYVSRGVLRSYKQGVGRTRLYRKADVDALAALRPGTPSQAETAPIDARFVAEERAPYAVPAPSSDDDRVARNVSLPPAESWVNDH